MYNLTWVIFRHCIGERLKVETSTAAIMCLVVGEGGRGRGPVYNTIRVENYPARRRILSEEFITPTKMYIQAYTDTENGGEGGGGRKEGERWNS